MYISMNALYQTSISFTSQNLGAKNYHRIDQTLVRCMCIVTLIGLVLGNGAHLLGNHLLHIYSDDLEVISFGMQRLSVISVTYCLCGMMDVLAGTIRGLGYSMLPMIVSLIGACVFRIIWIFTVFRVQHTLFICMRPTDLVDTDHPGALCVLPDRAEKGFPAAGDISARFLRKTVVIDG